MAELTERQEQVLEFLRDYPFSGGVSALHISDKLYGNHPGRGGPVLSTLKALERRGLIERVEYGWAALADGGDRR